MVQSSDKEYTTVEEYLLLQKRDIRTLLNQIRSEIKEAAPEAEEVISFQMPAYKYKGMVAFFAAASHHIGLYLPPEVLLVFKDKLKDYSMSKSAVRIPFDRPLPSLLIKEMIRYSVDRNIEKWESKKARH